MLETTGSQEIVDRRFTFLGAQAGLMWNDDQGPSSGQELGFDHLRLRNIKISSRDGWQLVIREYLRWQGQSGWPGSGSRCQRGKEILGRRRDVLGPQVL
eukprot:9117528-Pyramimonas_sp.AAC.1